MTATDPLVPFGSPESCRTTEVTPDAVVIFVAAVRDR